MNNLKQSYHIVVLKLSHCKSIAVFFLSFHFFKNEIYKPLRWWLLNFWIINFWILWNTNIVLCMKKLLNENHGQTRCRNLPKWEFWKVEHLKLFWVKLNSIFGAAYYKRKYIFLFLDALSLIFSKTSWLKNFCWI